MGRKKAAPIPADLTWEGGMRTDEAIEERINALAGATTADALSGGSDDVVELIRLFEIEGLDVRAVQFPDTVVSERDRLLFILPILDMDVQRAVHALYPDLGPLSVRVRAAALMEEEDFRKEYNRVAGLASATQRTQIENLGLRRLHHVISHGKDADAVSAFKAVAATKVDVTALVKPGEEFLSMLLKVGEAEAAAYRMGYEDGKPVDALPVEAQVCEPSSTPSSGVPATPRSK